MEVLSASSVVNIPTPASPCVPGPSKHRSLLERRALRPTISPDLASGTPSSKGVLDPATTLLSTEPSIFTAGVSAAGSSVRAPRSSSSAVLPFVPLTPIMASPRLTPDIGPGPGPPMLVDLDGEHIASDSGNGSEVVIPEAINVQSPSQDSDLHVPDVVRLPDTSALAPGAALPTPSWTSTPPTPPLEATPTTRSDSPENDGSPSRTRKRSKSRPGHVRPASVAVFPAYKPPSPPPLQLCDTTPSSSTSASPLASPDSALEGEMLSLAELKRSRTLPKNFGKVPRSTLGEPVASGSRSTDYLPSRVGVDMDDDGVLPPSLSRHSRLRRRGLGDRSPLGTSVVSRDDSIGSGRGRKMFLLDDEDVSEGENENENDDGEQELPHSEGSHESATTDEQAAEMELDRQLKVAGVKRYHALMELLVTEVGYLTDLRALVKIYLAHLPSLNAPISSTMLSRPSPSSISISSLGKSRPIQPSRSATVPVARPGPPTSDCPSAFSDKYADLFVESESDKEKSKGEKDKDKQAKRALFSDADLQTIRRNAEQLLQLHEEFVKLLREKLEPLGFASAFVEGPAGKERVCEPVSPIGSKQVDEAVNAAAEVFSQQASSFELYESFCPEHNEALSLVRYMQERYPVEWDSYEQRCSLRVAYEFELAAHSSCPASNRVEAPVQPPSPYLESESVKRKRRHSMSSVALTSALSPFGVLQTSPSHVNVVSPTKGEPSKAQGQAGRLKFLDYLIKPVQRLCKYPLLLEQLRVKRKVHGATVCEVGPVDDALDAMRQVVARVDRASERQAHRLKSALIASRLVPNAPTSPTSEGHGLEAKTAHLTPEFMGSLGVCLLAGALDVVYPQAGGSLRVKYLAAFLYIGGYLILAKVPKGGKGYEPRHWFSLSGFELFDEEEDDAALPYAFHLHRSGYHLHLAAACQLEKTIWMAAIEDALSVLPPDWENEPIPNVPADERPPTSATEEIVSDWGTPLPTIQSMSELETAPDPGVPTVTLPLPSPKKMAKTISKVDGIALRQEYQLAALNRRTSTSSVKAFFAPLSFESKIARPSSQIRQQVDTGLNDVFSDTFLTVRAQAQMRDEELFQLRRKQGNVSRSNSGLSISGAFGSRRRHDTGGLPSRRKNSVDGILEVISDPETNQKPTATVTVTKRSKSAIAKRRGKLALSVVPSQAAFVDGEQPPVQSPEGSLDTPSPLTQCSSTSSSNVGSALPSPMDGPSPLPIPLPGSDPRRPEYAPKRARSMVDNVRHFFQPRSTSPAPSLESSPKTPPVSLDVEPETPGGLVHWLRRGSLRRRVQSSPEAPPADDSSPSTPAASEDSHTSSKSLSTNDTNEPSTESSESPSTDPPRATPRRVAFSDATPIRRRSLFSSSSRSDFSSSPSNNESSLPRSKTLKNMFLFQRPNNFTRIPDLES